MQENGDDDMPWNSDYQSSTNQESVRTLETFDVDELTSPAPEISSHLTAASGDNPGADFLEPDQGSMHPMMNEPREGVEYTSFLGDEGMDFFGGRTISADMTAVGNQYATPQEYAQYYAASVVNTGSWQLTNQGAVSQLVGDTSYQSNTVSYGRQNALAEVGTYGTAAVFEPQHGLRLPVHEWASDSTFPDQAQRFGANLQHDTLTPHMRMTSVLEQTGDIYSRSPPWNPLDLRGSQVATETTPCYGYATTPSQDPCAYNSASTLSSTMPSTATSSSRRHDLSDSISTIRPQLTPSNLDQLGYESREYRSQFLVPGAVQGDTAGVAACLNRRGSRAIGIGMNFGPQGFLTNTDTASSVDVPGQSSASSEVLYCLVVGCKKEFRGKNRRGTRSRHIRLKHKFGQEEKKYPCEVPSCSKVYCRQDARLKHYRRRHSDVIHVAAAKSRK